MAYSKPKRPKSKTVAQFPAPESAVAVEDVPQEFQEPATPPLTETQPPTRSPLKKKASTAPPISGDFFARVAEVPRDAWGNSVFLYLYVLEPLCNLKQSGGRTYLNRYSEPVKDEHQIMMEYGSGRYRLMLSMNKVSPEESNEIARFEFEIYNAQYPPKIPRAAWVNDSRNVKWEALLPKETPAGAASSIVETMRVVNEMRRDMREEIAGDQPEPASTNEVLQAMKAAKELFAPAATTPPPATADPMDIAVRLFTIMNQTKAENPVIDMYRDELKAMREELKEARATAPSSKGLGDQLVEIAALSDKLEPLKKLFGFANGNGDGIRVGRTTGLDVVKEVTTKFFESDLANGVGQWLGSLATKNANGNGAPIMNPGQPNAVQPQGTPDAFQTFVRDVVNPALLSHYVRGLSGSDFAGWLADGYPDRVAQLQNFTHPNLPGLRGAAAIVSAYKHTPSMWPALSSQGEPAFVEFVNDFCSWQPQGEEEPTDVEHRTIEVEPNEEGPERI